MKPFFVRLLFWETSIIGEEQCTVHIYEEESALFCNDKQKEGPHTILRSNSLVENSLGNFR